MVLPEYFLCPISLEIMKDPVTTVTGITYDRQSIEQWLATAAVCPVTKQPMPPNSDLTPNHMLRRLIQAWCTANAIDRIPTPKSPLQRSVLLKLIRELNRRDDPNALIKMDELAAGDDGNCKKNRICMAEAGVPAAMVSFIVRSFRGGNVWGLEEALRILKLTWTPPAEIAGDNTSDLIQSIMWILKLEIEDSAKANALIVLKNLAEMGSPALSEKLKMEFFSEMVRVLKEQKHCARAALQILIETSAWGRNRAMIVEAGAVGELIEMELRHGQQEKKTTELVFGVLAQVCACAEGRQQLLSHAAGMALVAKRLLRNSAATDDRALCVMESVARFAATREVVAEMLRVGAVAKLCMVMQADCADYLKRKAREILRLHSGEWSNSPCIQLYLLTRNPT